MKIFIGGMKKHHQEKFRRLFPDVEFTFASFEDNSTRWIGQANKADYCIVDQSRCTHSLKDQLQKYVRAPVLFTDRKAHMKSIVQEIMQHGKAGYSYAGVPGSESSFGSCQWTAGGL